MRCLLNVTHLLPLINTPHTAAKIKTRFVNCSKGEQQQKITPTTAITKIHDSTVVHSHIPHVAPAKWRHLSWIYYTPVVLCWIVQKCYLHKANNSPSEAIALIFCVPYHKKNPTDITCWRQLGKWATVWGRDGKEISNDCEGLIHLYAFGVYMCGWLVQNSFELWYWQLKELKFELGLIFMSWYLICNA